MAATLDKAAVGAAEVKEEKAKRKREPYQENYKSEKEAIDAAESRVKGPRRAFKLTSPDKKHTFYIVAHNEGRAGGVAAYNVGWVCEELGAKRRSKPMDAASIAAGLAAMTDEQKAAVMAQLKAMGVKLA